MTFAAMADLILTQHLFGGGGPVAPLPVAAAGMEPESDVEIGRLREMGVRRRPKGVVREKRSLDRLKKIGGTQGIWDFARRRAPRDFRRNGLAKILTGRTAEKKISGTGGVTVASAQRPRVFFVGLFGRSYGWGRENG